MPLLSRSVAARIVNLSNGLGSLTLNSNPTSEHYRFKLPAYNSSKAAVAMLTIVYATKLASQKIKANAADPATPPRI